MSRRSCVLVAAAIGVTALLGSSPARAQAPTPERQAEAQDLVNKAYQEHAAGREVAAVGLYAKAYEITHAAAILFNVATIYDRRLHERTLAMEYFRRYIGSPDATPEFIQKATDRLAALKRDAEEEERKRVEEDKKWTQRLAAPLPPEPPVRASASPSADKGGSSLRTVGFVVGGVGLATIGASLVLGAVAKNRDDTANQNCSATTCRNTTGVSAEHDAVSFATASTGAFIGGGVLLAAGVTLALVAPSHTTAVRITIAPRVGTSGGGLALNARF
jgi:hypothetical protein